jgi:choline transporter-like protein 2/4/5
MDRSCTDIICCLVFVAFLVGMVGCAGYGSLYGDPNKLLVSWDADQNGCGWSPDTKDYKYLYFPTVNFQAAQKMAASL